MSDAPTGSKGASTTTADAERLDAETLYRRHAGFVARFVGQLGVAPADRSDVVQEVFVVAHRLGGFVPREAAATTWLARIAIRVASDYRRTKRRKPEHLDETVGATIETPRSSPLDDVETWQRIAKVRGALETLESHERAAFVLYELEGQTAEVVAQALGIPTGTVYSRIHKARSKFIEAYTALGGEVWKKT